MFDKQSDVSGKPPHGGVHHKGTILNQCERGEKGTYGERVGDMT